MVDIIFTWTTPTGEFPNAYHTDYFRDQGCQRAYAAKTGIEADAILRETYIGPDADGVGLYWDIYENGDICDAPQTNG